MKKVKMLFKWGIKYWYMTLFVLVTTILLQYLYSEIPLFIQYGIKVLEGVNPEVGLQKIFLNILSKYQDIVAILLCLAIFIISVQGSRSILRFFDNYTKQKMNENVAKDLRDKIYKHVDKLSYSYHNNVDTGDLIQRCTTDVETTSRFISMRFVDFIHIIATIIIGAYRVGSINITLMLVSIILIPITGVASTIYFKYVSKKFKEIEDSESKMTTIIQENLASVRVVRAFNTEKYEMDKMDKQSQDYLNKNLKFSKVMAFYWGASDALTMVQYTLTVAVSIYLAKQGLVDAADISACLMLMGMLIWPIRGLGRVISDYGKALVAAERIDEVLRIPTEYINDGEKTPEIKGNIEFRNVSFKFDDTDKYLLNNISFNIKQGETIAIVGKTGSGKSTLMNILTRMVDYNQGEIYLDGVELKEIRKQHVRKNIGTVLQNPFLFSKTIYDNIAIADNSVNKESIYEAARIAALQEEIEKFEEGYDTIVGERGTTLSGGQKQRVAIARILTSNKPVIVFDDSLSAVDTETDLMIRRALKEKNKDTTMIIITHRTTTAKEADKIIVLNDGVVSEMGTHDELAYGTGLYSKLWSIQGKLEEEFLKVLNGGE